MMKIYIAIFVLMAFAPTYVSFVDFSSNEIDYDDYSSVAVSDVRVDNKFYYLLFFVSHTSEPTGAVEFSFCDNKNNYLSASVDKIVYQSINKVQEIEGKSGIEFGAGTAFTNGSLNRCARLYFLIPDNIKTLDSFTIKISGGAKDRNGKIFKFEYQNNFKKDNRTRVMPFFMYLNYLMNIT